MFTSSVWSKRVRNEIHRVKSIGDIAQPSPWDRELLRHGFTSWLLPIGVLPSNRSNARLMKKILVGKNNIPYQLWAIKLVK